MSKRNINKYKMRQLAGTLFVVLIIGMLLYLVMLPNISEGFEDGSRCGVDLPSCSGEHIRCINGYCKSDIPKQLPLLSDLPMVPTQYTQSPF
jgi:hypothetical protein